MRLGRAGRAKTAPCLLRSSLPGVSPIFAKVCLIHVWLSTNISTFTVPVAQHDSPSTLAVFDRYSKYSKIDVAKAIDLEMKGDVESCLTAIGKTLKKAVVFSFSLKKCCFIVTFYHRCIFL